MATRGKANLIVKGVYCQTFAPLHPSTEPEDRAPRVLAGWASGVLQAEARGGRGVPTEGEDQYEKSEAYRHGGGRWWGCEGVSMCGCGFECLLYTGVCTQMCISEF